MNHKYIVFDIETTGLSPLNSEITCICAKDDEGNSFRVSAGKMTEGEMIKEFMNFVMERIAKGNYGLVSCNGKKFDLPFIFLRYALNSGNVKELEPLIKVDHFDIQETTYRPISLNDMAKLLKCESKSGTGVDAIKLADQNRWGELEGYCLQDVHVTEQVYLKIR